MKVELLYPKGDGFADPRITTGTPAGQLGPAVGLQVEGTAKEWQDLVSVLERKAPDLSLPVKEYSLLRSCKRRSRLPFHPTRNDWAITGESEIYQQVLYGFGALDIDKILYQVAPRRYYYATKFLCRIVF